MTNSMGPKIVFFGTPEYSVLVLDRLHAAGFPVVGVVTKPPRPIGRKQVMTRTMVALWAEKHNIPVFTPESDETIYWKYKQETEVISKIKEWHPDLLVVADYTQKIPQPLIAATRFGGLNVHPSLLPLYRGPAPIPWALINGETETGVSIVTLAEEFDSGIIIAQEKEPISETDTTDTLLTRLFAKGAALLVQTILNYIENPTSYQLQATSSSSYYPRLTRDHGFEPWEKIKQAVTDGFEAERIERKFRAFHPWPGLWTEIKQRSRVKGKGERRRLKILKLHLEPTHKTSTSITLTPSPFTLHPHLVLDEIQFEGKKPQKVTPQIVHQLITNDLT